MADRMVIRNGEVEIADGEALNIDFHNCIIYLDSKSKLIGCTVDQESRVVGTNG